MVAYDYPQVRPPSAMQLNRHENPQPPTQPRPMGREDRHFSWIQTPIEPRGQTFGRQENLPPLPRASTHLSSTPTQPRIEDSNPPVYPTDKKSANMYHNQPWRSAAEGIKERDQSPLNLIQEKSPQSPPQTYTKTFTLPIAPDENPLSPSNPNRTNTTNLPVIPPPSSTPTYTTTFAQPSQSTQGGSWTSSLFSCSEPAICFPAIFCPCIVYGKTQHRLNLRAAKKDPTNMLGYTSINGSCMAFGLLCGINGILATIQHTRVRKTYGMSGEAGNVFSDCVRSCCCCCCTVAQDEKEVRRREGGGIPENTGEGGLGYQPPGGMVFAPPPR